MVKEKREVNNDNKEQIKKIKNKSKEKTKKSSTPKSKNFSFKSEFNKIKWPSKKEMIKYSIATIVFIIFFALFFFAIDKLMRILIDV